MLSQRYHWKSRTPWVHPNVLRYLTVQWAFRRLPWLKQAESNFDIAHMKKRILQLVDGSKLWWPNGVINNYRYTLTKKVQESIYTRKTLQQGGLEQLKKSPKLTRKSILRKQSRFRCSNSSLFLRPKASRLSFMVSLLSYFCDGCFRNLVVRACLPCVFAARVVLVAATRSKRAFLEQISLELLHARLAQACDPCTNAHLRCSFFKFRSIFSICLQELLEYTG